MNKEVFDRILKVLSKDFKSIGSSFKYIRNCLSNEEIECLDNFKPYICNQYVRRLDINEDSFTIRTVSREGELSLHINELHENWQQNKNNKSIVRYIRNNKDEMYCLEIELKQKDDYYYFEQKESLWDSGLGDYQYIERCQSRCYTIKEIEDLFIDKLNNGASQELKDMA